MDLITAFVVADPSKLEKGVCTRCGAYRPWGDGKTCIKLQHASGEVRHAVCSRCGGTGIEPPEWFSTGVWWKPWTWFTGRYLDAFGVEQPPPKRFPLEIYP